MADRHAHGGDHEAARGDWTCELVSDARRYRRRTSAVTSSSTATTA
ncbi:MAG TPA: hypothetical protein VLA98_05700 [Solirubrobacteraceae bacterium]|nr:hypothetical protein [Solirubrobacteraceae bacterium]